MEQLNALCTLHYLASIPADADNKKLAQYAPQLPRHIRMQMSEYQSQSPGDFKAIFTRIKDDQLALLPPEQRQQIQSLWNQTHTVCSKLKEDILNQWVNQNSSIGNRQEAANRIRAYMQDPSSGELDLSHLGLTSLPPILALPPFNTTLTRLNISNNMLSILPLCINSLQNLEVLDASSCCLMSLTDTLRNCENLKKLYLRDNPALSALPDFLTERPHLEIFQETKDQG